MDVPLDTQLSSFGLRRILADDCVRRISGTALGCVYRTPYGISEGEQSEDEDGMNPEAGEVQVAWLDGALENIPEDQLEVVDRSLRSAVWVVRPTEAEELAQALSTATEPEAATAVLQTAVDKGIFGIVVFDKCTVVVSDQPSGTDGAPDAKEKRAKRQRHGRRKRAKTEKEDKSAAPPQRLPLAAVDEDSAVCRAVPLTPFKYDDMVASHDGWAGVIDCVLFEYEVMLEGGIQGVVEEKHLDLNPRYRWFTEGKYPFHPGQQVLVDRNEADRIVSEAGASPSRSSAIGRSVKATVETFLVSQLRINWLGTCTVGPQLRPPRKVPAFTARPARSASKEMRGILGDAVYVLGESSSSSKSGGRLSFVLSSETAVSVLWQDGSLDSGISAASLRCFAPMDRHSPQPLWPFHFVQRVHAHDVPEEPPADEATSWCLKGGKSIIDSVPIGGNHPPADLDDGELGIALGMQSPGTWLVAWIKSPETFYTNRGAWASSPDFQCHPLPRWFEGPAPDAPPSLPSRETNPGLQNATRTSEFESWVEILFKSVAELLPGESRTSQSSGLLPWLRGVLPFGGSDSMWHAVLDTPDGPVVLGEAKVEAVPATELQHHYRMGCVTGDVVVGPNGVEEVVATCGGFIFARQPGQPARRYSPLEVMLVQATVGSDEDTDSEEEEEEDSDGSTGASEESTGGEGS